MKKLLCILLASLLFISFVSCGDDPPVACTEHVDANADARCDVCDAELDPAEPEEPADDDSVTLIEDGVAKFKLVVSKNNSSSTIQKAAKSIVDALDDLDIEIDLITESESNETDLEVFIGAPTMRGDDS